MIVANMAIDNKLSVRTAEMIATAMNDITCNTSKQSNTIQFIIAATATVVYKNVSQTVCFR